MTPRVDVHSEAGYTLGEVLVALIVFGVAIIAIVTAMGSSIIASDIHRKLVTDDAIVRSYAEKLAAAPFVECATSASSGYSPAGVGLDLSQWPGYQASVMSVSYWDGNTASSTLVFTGSCPPPAGSAGAGLQRITLEAHPTLSTTGRGGHQQLTVLKRRS